MLTFKQQEGLIRHITHYNKAGQTTLKKHVKEFIQDNELEFDKADINEFFENPCADIYWDKETAVRDMIMEIIISHIKKYNPKKRRGL